MTAAAGWPSVRASGRLERLAETLTAICQDVRDECEQASCVEAALRDVLRTRDWLPKRLQETDPTSYRPHLAYVADDGAFSIVSMAWLPGQTTPIHDHIAWCVVGVYRGQEVSTGYELHEEDGERFLVRTRDQLMLPGDTAALVPPDEDIHRVTCLGRTASVSLHVYGADVARHGSSINHCFDNLRIAERRGASRISWRRAAAWQ